MAIKNRDGTEYYFTKPNPLLASQSLWPKDEKIILEGNFSEKVVLLPPKQKEVEGHQAIEQPVDEIEIVQNVIKKQNEEMVQNKGGVIDMWVLPTIFEKSIDTLYNETYSRPKFGDKINIKAKVYDNTSDLAIQIITRQILSEGSVIYPQNGARRWWQVVRTDEMEQKGFYLVTAEISNYQPSFSS